MISLATSKVTKEVRDNVNACLDDNRISGGRFIEEFEKRVADYHGAKYGIAVNNGTMADIVALAVLKAKNPGKDEVIVPALTFIAQTNAVLVNGLKPVFVDITKDGQMDMEKVEEKITEKTLCVMPANLLGKNADIDALKEIIDPKYIIEDNCEAYGIRNDVAFSTYSFFPSHTITTGEGGMLLTDDEDLARFARACRNHGRLNEDILNKFHFPIFGLNGKMTNIAAAIGCAITDSADYVIKKRRKNVEMYNSILGGSWYAFSPHCYPVICESEEKRNSALKTLDENGIEARKLFSCLPTVEYGLEGDYPIAEYIGKVGLFVPVHQDITEDDIKTICNFL